MPEQHKHPECIQQFILYDKPVDIQPNGVHSQRRFLPLNFRNGLVPPGIDSRRKQVHININIDTMTIGQ